MKRKGILFVVSGPSGVGKGTITETITELIQDIKVSISTTTRKPRTGEVYGRDYFFISEKMFHLKISNDEFLEWAQVYSNYYGTPKEFVSEQLESGKDVLLEIDIQGAMQVKEKMPAGVYIFLAPPNINELAKRLNTRGKDTPESMQKRLSAFDEEMNHAKYYDYLVVNDYIQDAVEKVKAIIIAERCKIK